MTNLAENILTEQYKTVKLELKSVNDSGEFSGYASYFGNVDSYNDVVVKGAFANTLTSKSASDIRLLWQHDPSVVIGYIKEIREDDVGLFFKAQLMFDEIEKAKEARALLKAGAIDGISIGFNINPGGTELKDGIRYITDINLWEVSIVTFPANKLATVQSVKSIETIRDFEKFLRDVGGFSNAQAKEIASKGFARGVQRDVENQTVGDDEYRAILNTLTNLKDSL